MNTIWELLNEFLKTHSLLESGVLFTFLGIGLGLSFLISKGVITFIFQTFQKKNDLEISGISYNHVKDIIDLHFKNMETFLNALESFLKSESSVEKERYDTTVKLIEQLKENLKVLKDLVEKDNKEIKDHLNEIKDRLHNLQWRE